MRKKSNCLGDRLKRFFCILVVCVLAVFVYLWGSFLADAIHLKSMDKAWDRSSIFTEESLLNKQQVYEGQTLRVLYNYRPILPGHVLIIPKRPVGRVEELTDEEWGEMRQAIKIMHKVFQETYQADDYVLLVQNGLFGGQTVPHMHMHMIPRDKQHIVLTKFRLWGALFSSLMGFSKPLSDKKLRHTIVELQSHLP